ncbi:hypothetical protein EJC49_16655 [Aquibium carbonis]|uniref:PIN domain-containing protein n=1 Tax=Aquibium carbonis TaxID=2495581 RepID=A0A429YV00_9HYPH|nr:hypothetical protein [Aquibium carbonis]RST85263.1 hypothetical protein EJC49_16655 [Aquibium carbonis]
MIRPGAVILDTNLAVLLVVGLADRAFIGQHKRLAAFDEIDFDHLKEVVDSHTALVFSPNVLTETNNIVRQAPVRARDSIQMMFGNLIHVTAERYVESTLAVSRPEFRWLGLSDAVILLLASNETLILTSDVGLYVAAQNAGLPSENFNHWKDQRPDYRI